MKQIPLTQGKFAIVDDGDYEWLNKYKWYAVKNRNTYYAVRKPSRKQGKRTRIYMHRQILDAPKELQVDHANHNGLDNRRQNIRTCTHKQQQHNRLPVKNSSSKYKGVQWYESGKKWKAKIGYNNQYICLGYFVNEVDAAKAYDEKARELFGEFAYTNFKG